MINSILKTLGTFFVPKVSLGFLSGLSNLLGDITGSNVKDVGVASSNATSFKPTNINIEGLGSVTGTKEGNTTNYSTTLDPTLKALQDRLFSIGGSALTQAEGFDVPEIDFDREGMSKNISDRLRRLSAPKEQRDRLRLENRLFKQGLLSSSTGAERFGELFDAQSLAELERTLQADELAGSELDRLEGVRQNRLQEQANLFDRGTLFSSNAMTIGQAPISLLDRSIAASGARSAAAANAGALNLQGAQYKSDAVTDLIDSLLQGASSAFTGGLL